MSLALPQLNFTFPHAGNIAFTLQQLVEITSAPEDPYVAEISRILKWWYCTEDPLIMTTSGTTAKPISKSFERQQVLSAAHSSMSLLGPPENGNALLAIHPGYAGGRMLLIRSLMAKNNVICIPPTANPLTIVSETALDYASFVPYQITEILKNETSARRLCAINTVLIGGAAISPGNWSKLCELPNRIFSTYGMTETLSHVAVRRAAPGDAGYTPVPGITLYPDERGCLVVESAWLGRVITNDLIEWQGSNGRIQSFIWKGRADTIINSGGLLVRPEQIENKLIDFFNKHPEATGYFIISEPDELLGQRVVLYIESNHSETNGELVHQLENYCRANFQKEEIPRRVKVVPKFKRTGSGKIDKRSTADYNYDQSLSSGSENSQEK